MHFPKWLMMLNSFFFKFYIIFSLFKYQFVSWAYFIFKWFLLYYCVLSIFSKWYSEIIDSIFKSQMRCKLKMMLFSIRSIFQSLNIFMAISFKDNILKTYIKKYTKYLQKNTQYREIRFSFNFISLSFISGVTANTGRKHQPWVRLCAGASTV